MGYRDEYEALHQRLRLLEERLEAYEGERHASLEEEIRALREQVDSSLHRIRGEELRLSEIGVRLGRLQQLVAPNDEPLDTGSTLPITMLTMSLVMATAFAAWGAPSSRCASPQLMISARSVLVPEVPESEVVWSALRSMGPAVENCAAQHAPQMTFVDVSVVFEGRHGRMASVEPLVGGSGLAACLDEARRSVAPVGRFRARGYELTYAYPVRGTDWSSAFGPRVYQGPRTFRTDL